MNLQDLNRIVRESEALDMEDIFPFHFMLDHQCARDLRSLYYRFLFRLADYMKPATIVELGTWHGASAYAMASANAGGRVITYDTDSGSIWAQARLQSIEFVNEDSLNVRQSIGPIDILFIDTLHDGVLVQKEFDAWRTQMAGNGVILFDDIRLNEQMSKWWDGFDPGPGCAKVELPLHGSAGFAAVLLNANE